MLTTDILFVLKWWIVVFGIGIIFLPLTAYLFRNFFDKGYIFSKILGIIFLSYFIFILGILKILPFTQITILLALTFFLILNLFIFAKVQPLIRLNLKTNWRVFLLEEFIFLTALIFWSIIKAYQPDIHGLEKFMDFGFINSILRSDYFPPLDMWLTPFPINYYFFGHLITAFLTKISGIPSSISYNLMLSSIFAFTFTSAFSIGANLIYLEIKNQKSKIKNTIQNSKLDEVSNDRFKNLDFEHRNLFERLTFFRILFSGLLTAILLTFAGNLHTIYTFFKPYVNENPIPFWQLPISTDAFPNSYWYPNATRFIYNTIHEFPIYSFVVSDLHGHVLDIPIVLLTIAILISLIFNSKFEIFNQIQMFKKFKIKNSFQTKNLKLKILLLSFLLAVMYMTNAWDGIIYFILTSLILLYSIFQTSIFFNEKVKSQKLKVKNIYQNVKIVKNFDFKNLKLISNSKLKIKNYIFMILILIVGFILFSLPFSLNFKPFVSGIGVLCAPDFLTNIGKIGPFLFEKDHCQKSPLWQLFILYGFFYFWIIIFIMKLKTQNSKLKTTTQNLKCFRFWNFEHWSLFRILSISDLFVLLLILTSTLLIIVPEFIYIKDIYPAHYRANTMFKLVYQSFIMLSIASGYIITKIITNFKFLYWKFVVLVFIGIIGLFLVMIYPYFAINSYFENLKNYHGLDGIIYLKKLYPNDYEAIKWINVNIKKQPVILEAQGDSYTDFARVSTNTGLPTVLGWTVHEWLWRGKYEIPAPRINEVQALYETKDLKVTQTLIKKYSISLVFVGDLERQKYINLNEEKFNLIGSLVFKNGQTKIYKIK